ncbi:MAG: glycosyltransferase family 4 protein, partial [Candidatus Brocadiales bacterium]|nr:glycosyltransferase family 4 protein [Candidatus Bathyanammoxibius sp.]
PDEHAGAAGAQLMWRIITGLAKVHQIILISFVNPEEDPTPLEQKGIRLHSVPYPRHYGSWTAVPVRVFLRRGLKLLISIFRFKPYELEKYRNRAMRRLAARVIAEEKVDVVQCEYNLTALNLPKGVTAPKVLVEHDVSMKPYARLMTSGHSSVSRLVGRFQSWFWRHTEPGLCNQFDSVITLTAEDKNYLRERGVQVPIQVIPPPVNVRTDIQVDKNTDVCFVGSFNRRPNQEALDEILSDIWPVVKRDHAACRLMIAGKHLTGKLLDRIQSDDRITYAGFVADIDTLIASCSVFLAPIRLGGGLKMKITHALACGTPVVATAIGAEGIEIRPGEGLIVEDNPLEMARLALGLLHSPGTVERLSAAAAQAVQQKFSLSRAIERYQRIYHQLVLKSGRG